MHTEQSVNLFNNEWAVNMHKVTRENHKKKFR